LLRRLAPAPDWLKGRLESVGQKSINNIVDVLNYAMFDTGQPLHAFDMEKMKKKDGRVSIVVRTAHRKENIQTLDGEKYALDENDLLITDGNSNKPLGIAGVKGGKSNAIIPETRNIIIESANFNPTNIRKTSKILKLRTDASTRFEHEISPELTSHALQRVVELISELAGGEIEGYIDVYSRKQAPYKIGVSSEEVNSLLGSHIKDQEIKSILGRLHFLYEKVKPIDKVLNLVQTFEGKPYKHGASVSFDAPNSFDCSSLVSFLFVQGGVAVPRMSIDQYFYGKDVAKKELLPGDVVFSNSGEGKVHYESIEFLRGTKLKKGVDHCGLYLGKDKVVHASKEAGRVIIEDLETSNAFKNVIGIRRMTENKDRFVVTIPFSRLDLRIKEDLIEEIGRIYGYEKIVTAEPQKMEKKAAVNKKLFYTNKIRKILVGQGFSEVYTYSFVDKGEIELENPIAENKNYLRNSLQDNLKRSLEFNFHNADLLGLEQIKIFEIGKVFTKNGEYTSLAIGMSEGKGLEDIINHISQSLDVRCPKSIENNEIYEVNFDELIRKLPQPRSYEEFKELKDAKYQPISLYPFVLRDIAVWVPKEIQSDQVLGIIEKEAGKLLVKTRLFDQYFKDENVSYAFRLAFQSMKRTLTDEEVNKIMIKIINIIGGKRRWQVR